MHIIPVIDLMYGQVVHAHAGQRNAYKPIRSQLTRSCEPLSVVGALLSLYPFETIYFADLQAITGDGDHRDVLKTISCRHPDLEIWLDAGCATPKLCRLTGNSCVPVFGSESFSDPVELRLAMTGFQDPVLSLDFRHDTLLNSQSVTESVAHWPRRVILMHLDQVGCNEGIQPADSDWIRNYPGHDFYLAGGMRGNEDLCQARIAGAAGVLLATALHNGTISALHIREIISFSAQTATDG